MCTVFVSSFSCVIRWRWGVSFSLTHSVRLVFCLACSSRGASRRYSLRLVSRPVLLVNSLASRRPFCSAVRYLVSSSGLSFRLARRSSVFRLVRFISPRLVFRFSSRRGVSSSSSYFRFARRFVSAARRASRVLSVSRLVLSCSHPSISLVASHGHGGRVACWSCPCLVAACLFPCFHPSSWRGVAMAGWACRLTIRGARRFIQLVFPIRAGMK